MKKNSSFRIQNFKRVYFLPIFFFGIVTIVLSFLFFGNSQEKQEVLDVPTKKNNEELQTFSLQKEKYAPQLELTGTVEANKQVSINTAIAGRISELMVDTGDVVEKGQLLAKLSSHDNSAEIQYQNALDTFNKTKSTVQNNIYQSEINLQNVELDLKKTIQTQGESYGNTFELLITQSKSTESVLRDAYYWADRTMLATSEAQNSTFDEAYYHLGSNQSVEKQNIQTEIEELYFEMSNKYGKQLSVVSPTFDASSEGELRVLEYAQERLAIARRLRSILSRISTLIIKTPTRSLFSGDVRSRLGQESTQYSNSLDLAIMSLDSSIKKATFQREYSQEVVSTAESKVRNAKAGLDLVKASTDGSLNIARNQINIAKLSQNELQLKAPFDGVIIKKNVEVGQLISAGTALFEIADLSTMKIKTNIPDIWVGDMQNKKVKTEIRISGIRDQVFLGSIQKIDPAVDAQTRKIGIEIAFEEPKEVMKIGMFASITVSVQGEDAYFIPYKFLRSDFNGTYVVLPNEVKKYVEKGAEDQNRVQISFKGITDGIEIIDIK